jgi:uncharacterized protein
MAEPLLIAQSKEPQYLLPKMANRHGLVAGATDTGKTVTLQVMRGTTDCEGRAGIVAGWIEQEVETIASSQKGGDGGTDQPCEKQTAIASCGAIAAAVLADDFGGEPNSISERCRAKCAGQLAA